jgi:hypothetical protein
MSHFAQLDDKNNVINIVVGDNNDPNGDEGYKWLIDNLGGRWVQTSYNGNFRKQYAGIGFTYDEANDVFVSPKPYPSWVLDANQDWQAPVEYPTDGFTYEWNESELAWEPQDFSEPEA